MKDKILSYLIIILLSIAAGMMMAMVIIPSYKYHGPNAEQESKKIYFNKKTGKCLRFAIKPFACPKKFRFWK